jgi:hypothetical protein
MQVNQSICSEEGGRYTPEQHDRGVDCALLLLLLLFMKLLL